MRLSMTAKVKVLAKESRESNGNTYYSLAILQDSQAGSISCNKDVFGLVEPMNDYELAITYNDIYKSLSATCFLGAVGSNSAPKANVPATSK